MPKTKAEFPEREGRRKGEHGYAAGWCVHYRGISDGAGGWNTSCWAGVEYDQFRGKPHGEQPCFLTKEGKSKPNALPCEKLRLPTPEEISTNNEFIEQRLNMLRVVMQTIRPWREKNKGKSAKEIVECPICKGRLQLSISAYNGHVHGHCETPDCVSWME